MCTDGAGVEVQEGAMIVSVKSRSDQPALDKIAMLSDWTAVDKTDHDTDHDTDQYSDHADIDAALTDAFNATPNVATQCQTDVEPVTEEDVVAGVKVKPRTNLLGDEPFGKLTMTGGPPTVEEVITVSETSAVMRSAPRSTTSPADPNQVDRVMVAPQRRSLKEGWVGQAARSQEFSWLGLEPSVERHDSVDSLPLTDEIVVTVDTSAQVESAPPLPAVSEDMVTADMKSRARFDVDFSGLLVGSKVSTIPTSHHVLPTEVQAEEEFIPRTSRVSTKRIDDFLALQLSLIHI